MCELINAIKEEIAEIKEMMNKVLNKMQESSDKVDKLMTKKELCAYLDVTRPTLNKKLKDMEYQGVLVGENERRFDPTKVVEELEKLDQRSSR